MSDPHDIIERLRNHERHAVHDHDDDCIAAAAEIEILRRRNQHLLTTTKDMARQIELLEVERAALRNTLETIEHDARHYHGEFWSAEFAKSALSYTSKED